MITEFKAGAGEDGLRKVAKSVEKPRREDYVVRDEMMQRIMALIPVQDGAAGWRDMYSTEATARFSDFVTCAETADWAEMQKVLWINPPYSQWKEVAERVKNSKSRCVCLVPNWGKEYEDQLLSVARGRWYIPSGTALFQLDGVRVCPTRWGCWLIEIDAGQRRPCGPGEELKNVTVLAWNRSDKSVGRKRRERAAAVKARR